MDNKIRLTYFDENGSSNAEEVARFKKALSKCRTCGHIRMAHSSLSTNKGECLDSRLTIKGGYESCSCHMFIPSDNLEYLEWAADSKEKRK